MKSKSLSVCSLFLIDFFFFFSSPASLPAQSRLVPAPVPPTQSPLRGIWVSDSLAALPDITWSCWSTETLHICSVQNEINLPIDVALTCFSLLKESVRYTRKNLVGFFFFFFPSSEFSIILTLCNKSWLEIPVPVSQHDSRCQNKSNINYLKSSCLVRVRNDCYGSRPNMNLEVTVCCEMIAWRIHSELFISLLWSGNDWFL